MRRIDFNKGWCFSRLGKEERAVAVDLPHDAMLAEPSNALAADGGNVGWHEGHDYSYIKIFCPGQELAGQDLILEFEGVYHNAEVYLNGEKLMFRPYGYTNFYVNISDKVKFGEENELMVIAHNADQPNSRWYSGAGIYRPVWLWAAPKEHILINGLRVRTVSIKPATVEITVLTQGSGEACIEIYDGDKTVVSGKAQSNGKCTLISCKCYRSGFSLHKFARRCYKKVNLS